MYSTSDNRVIRNKPKCVNEYAKDFFVFEVIIEILCQSNKVFLLC